MEQTLRLLTADLLVVIHFSFILFVIVGGLLALKYRNLLWLHIPALTWGILVELAGWVCPLTVYETQLRAVHGGSYTKGFIEHYLLPIIYPHALTREIQIGLGLLLLLFNCWVYVRIIRQRPLKDKRKAKRFA